MILRHSTVGLLVVWLGWIGCSCKEQPPPFVPVTASKLHTETPDAPELLQLVARQPGPAPWGLEKDRGMRVGAETWVWKGGPTPGRAQLQDTSGVTRLIAGFYVYALPAPRGRVLVHATVGDKWPDGISLALIDLSKAKPFKDVEKASLGATRQQPWAVSDSAVIAKILIPATLPEGQQSFKFPAAMKTIPGCYSALSDARVGETAVRRFHYLLCFSDDRIEVTDLAWFNNKDWSEGSHWISRVVPNPGKATYLAEVIREGVAELDESRKKVLRWVVEDRRWMPMSTDYIAEPATGAVSGAPRSASPGAPVGADTPPPAPNHHGPDSN